MRRRGLLRRYAPRNDGAKISDSIVKQREDVSPRSRGAIRPSFASHSTLLEAEGAGKAGCRLHPWVPCKKKHGGRTTGSTGNIRLSLRDGLRLTSRSCVCKICQNARTGGSRPTARRWI